MNISQPIENIDVFPRSFPKYLKIFSIFIRFSIFITQRFLSISDVAVMTQVDRRISQLLAIIDNASPPLQSVRAGLRDGLVDHLDLAPFEGATLDNPVTFRSRYNVSSELYDALTDYERLFGNGDRILQRDETSPQPIYVEVPQRNLLFPYPESYRVKVSDSFFGTMVLDPYRWLEDARSAYVQGWTNSQDRLAREVIAGFPGRDRVATRLRGLSYVDSISVPRKRGRRVFYHRRQADGERRVFCVREGANGRERVLLDPSTFNRDGGNISLGLTVPSNDGRKLAYLLRRNNSGNGTLHVMDVSSGRVSPSDVIEGVDGGYSSPSWTQKGNGFFYVAFPTDPTMSTTARAASAEVRFHKLGTDPKNDEVVVKATGDPTKRIRPWVSPDGRWLFVSFSRGRQNSVDIIYRDLTRPHSPFRTFYEGRDAVVSVVPWNHYFYIFTNDGSPNWRIDRVRSDNPDRENWQTIVPERTDVVLDNYDIIGGHLILTVLKNATPTLEVRTLEGRLVRTVSLSTLGAINLINGWPDDDTAFFSFESFLQPPQVYRASISSGRMRLWAENSVRADPSQYVVEQEWYPSRDGTRISMFLIHRKDDRQDGSTPYILTGYGGFGFPVVPRFDSNLHVWLEAGGGYAVANLRGGGEYGEQWHRSGMLDRKQNVADDFIAGAEHLIRSHRTDPARIAALGVSNGGLLIGAAITQRPDLFRAAVSSVPILDMLRYPLSGIGTYLIPEYGSPSDKTLFPSLFAFSPYHNVRDGQRYPAVLFLSADSDSRADPMHARKMAAALQNSSTSGMPILLRTQRNSGHVGADLVREKVEQDADMYSFLMQQLQMNFR